MLKYITADVTKSLPSLQLVYWIQLEKLQINRRLKRCESTVVWPAIGSFSVRTEKRPSHAKC